jgi:uncharacterized membrane protein YfcA
MDMLSLVLAMIATGAAGGVIAGLLGVGGGIVIVPVLEIVLGFVGVDPSIRMHVAVGTSLATIIPTSISSARAHHQKRGISTDLVRYWSPFIVIGAAIGTLVAGEVTSQTLYAVFSVVALIVALKMIMPSDDNAIAADVPRGILGPTVPLGIGLVSAMMGIGGGSMSVPVMTRCGRPIHVAIGTSALFGAFIAVPGTIGFIYTGWGNEMLPYGSLGFVNLVGFSLIVPATIVFAPLGAKLAHAMPKRWLSLSFGLFLLIVALRMAFQILD